MRVVLTLFLIIPLCAYCAPSPTLSEDEMDKLDPALQHLVEQDGDPEGPFQYQVSTRDDGTTVYGVVLRTDDPDALREAGLPVGSVFGDIVTARLSLEEIKQAARLEAVRAIRNSEQDAEPLSSSRRNP